MHEVSVDEAQAKLEKLISEALNGDIVGIRVGDQHAILLVPATISAPSRTAPNFKQFGQWLSRKPTGRPRRFFVMAEDFDAPISEFEEYMH